MSLFISFEGVDGSGKSTQARLLYRTLRRNGVPVRLVREPGTTALGERLRRILSSPRRTEASLSVDPLAEVFLFAAARAQLVKEIIFPSLHDGVTVISDRYVHSTIAYQGYGRGIDLTALETINRISTENLLPDLIVLLDVEPSQALCRRRSAPANCRFEEEELAFHQRIRDGYLKMAGEDPGRWFVVDASLPRETLAVMVWETANRALELGRRQALNDGRS